MTQETFHRDFLSFILECFWTDMTVFSLKVHVLIFHGHMWDGHDWDWDCLFSCKQSIHGFIPNVNGNFSSVFN